MSKDAIQPMSVEKVSSTQQALETFALNHQMLLERQYGVNYGDVQNFCRMARAYWYKQGRK